MGSLFLILMTGAATGFVWYQTIQGYRTGVLNVRTRIDRRVSPRLFVVMLVLMAVLSLVCLGAFALMTYGLTHPEWHAKRISHTSHMPEGPKTP
jgi:hypothetical protein